MKVLTPEQVEARRPPCWVVHPLEKLPFEDARVWGGEDA